MGICSSSHFTQSHPSVQHPQAWGRGKCCFSHLGGLGKEDILLLCLQDTCEGREVATVSCSESRDRTRAEVFTGPQRALAVPAAPLPLATKEVAPSWHLAPPWAMGFLPGPCGYCECPVAPRRAGWSPHGGHHSR